MSSDDAQDGPPDQLLPRQASESLPALALPQLRLPVRISNQTLRPWAEGLFPLEPRQLLDAVARRSGLSDFGDPGFEVPLAQLLEVPAKEDRYHALGRYRLRHEVRRHLGTRLRLHDLIKRHPEIENQTIDAPIFVLGLPGSGSQHLHAILSQIPALRSLPAWEAREPLPRRIVAEPDLDIAERANRLRQVLRRRRLAFGGAWPQTTGAQEGLLGDEQELMGIEFSSLLLELKYENKGYRQWRMTNSQRPAYETLRRLLQALQWLRGGERWILHSAQHIDQLETLLRVFPDARILHFHRDPYPVTQETSRWAYQQKQLLRPGISIPKMNQLWLDRTESLLRSCIRTRMGFPDLPVTDVRFADFRANPIGIAEDCLTAVGEPLPTTLPEEMRDFHKTAGHGKHDGMELPTAGLGPSPELVEERLGFYRDFFSIAQETSGWLESS